MAIACEHGLALWSRLVLAALDSGVGWKYYSARGIVNNEEGLTVATVIADSMLHLGHLLVEPVLPPFR